MAEPDAIFKNGAYMNVNEGQMYIDIYIAIHQATQCHQHYCSMWCSFRDIVTFVLMTAIFKNGGRESQNMSKMVYLKSLSHITYIHTPNYFSR